MSAKKNLPLQELASQLEMSYAEKEEWGLIALLKDFKLFRVGGAQKITNILSKKDEWLETETHVFDYQYTVSTGKSSVSFKQTVFFVNSKKLGLPHFWMKPETFFHKIGHFLGIKDINFEAFPQFSDQYYLKGDDEEYIRATMNEKVLHFFTIEKNWNLEGVNYFMIFYCHNTVIPPHLIKDFYKKGTKICEMLIMDPIV